MIKKNQIFLYSVLALIILNLTIWSVKNEIDIETKNIIKEYVLNLIYLLVPILIFLIMKVSEIYRRNEKMNAYSFRQTKNIILSWQFIVLNIMSFVSLIYFSSYHDNVILGFILFYINNSILTLLFVILGYYSKNVKYKNDRMLLFVFLLIIFAQVIGEQSEEVVFLVTSFLPFISINFVHIELSLISLILFILYLVIIIINHLKLFKNKNSLL